MSDIEQIVKALLRPDAYQERPQAVELVETHISYIFLTGPYVYKVKKPVDFGFLDFTTLEKRRHFCDQEVALNRRLSPDVYLGVVEISEEGDNYSVEGSGRAVEYAVKMRQLPRERMMDVLLRRGVVTPDMVQRLAEKIAGFHAAAHRSDEITRLGGLDAVRYNVQENFQQTRRFVGVTISPQAYVGLRAYGEAFMERRQSLFYEREAQGWVRDCHGDLHTAQICMENGISIIDCIEFNERFRYSDVASDIAFLAMDLDYHGRPDLSRLLMDAYIQQAGDPGVRDLVDFYKVYRAYVRGKVTSFNLDSSHLPERDRARIADSARRYFELAHSYVPLATQPSLFLVTGLMGTGKTTIAGEVALHVGGSVISSDAVRKELAGISPTEHRYIPWDSGIYSPDISTRTYEALLGRAREELAGGRSVVLDAAYRLRGQRQEAMAMAREVGAPFWVIEVICPEDAIRGRLDSRMERGGGISDGRWEIFARQKETFEEVTEAPAEAHITIDTSASLEDTVFTLLKELYGRTSGG